MRSLLDQRKLFCMQYELKESLSSVGIDHQLHEIKRHVAYEIAKTLVNSSPNSYKDCPCLRWLISKSLKGQKRELRLYKYLVFDLIQY